MQQHNTDNIKASNEWGWLGYRALRNYYETTLLIIYPV